MISKTQRWISDHLDTAPVSVVLLVSLALPVLSVAQEVSLPDAPATSTELVAHSAEPARAAGVATSIGLGSISGTVTDFDDAIIPGASILLEGSASGESQTAVADGSGAFLLSGIEPGGPYHVTITADGFAPWTSSAVTVEPGHFVFLSDIRM